MTRETAKPSAPRSSMLRLTVFRAVTLCSFTLCLFFVALCLAPQAYAEKVCQKLTYTNGKIKQKIKTVASTATCPKGHTKLLDSENLSPAKLPSGKLLTGLYGGFFLATAAGQYFTDVQ